MGRDYMYVSKRIRRFGLEVQFFWAKRCFEVERCSSLVEGSFQMDAKVWEKLIFGWKIKRECRIETEVSLWTLNFEVHVEVWV